MEKVWFQNYPEGSPTTLDTSKYDSILDILDKARLYQHGAGFNIS